MNGERVVAAAQRPVRVAVGLLSLACQAAVPAAPDAGSLADLSLEELSNIQITSVSKKAERLSDAAASVFVITADDIRRSGVRRLPDALRLAPNLQVTQISASGHSISARGFNGPDAGKLLVLVDGRSVYTPRFSGVFWDAQDVMLEDVERIEVISGPGGTLWGVNAVNGVINIITRSAASTQGVLVPAGIGNRDADAAVRYGGTLGPDAHYRVYGMYLDQYHTKTDTGQTKDDAWHKSQAGFRIDWSQGGDSLAVNANGYQASEGQPLPGTISIGIPLPLGEISISGANLTARWARALEGGSSFSLQGYYERTTRDVPPSFSETLDILDLQLQHSLRPIGIHTLVWGGEFRYGMDRITNASFLFPGTSTPFFGFLPTDVNQKWPSLFAQDEVRLREDLRLAVGARLERNDYTGAEFLPNGRVAWKVAADHLLWIAASRAVRAPSRFDRDTFVPAAPPFLLAGGPDVRSEVANVYEIGYRGQPTSRLSYSATVYHADYDHLRSQELAPSRTFFFFSNLLRGNTTGIETWATYQASEAWRIAAGLNALRERLSVKPGGNDAVDASDQEGNDPTHTWMLRSSFDFAYRTELDAMVRRVSALSHPLPQSGAYSVPAYTAVDLRAGWRALRDLELSITGRNLFSGGHGEMSDPATRTRFGQDVFFKLACRL